MRLALQLLKEFWIPLVVSVIWASIGLVWTTTPAWVVAVKDGAACFFLVSWATGQYFRVKKQTHVDSRLSEIVTRLTGVVEKIEIASDKTVAAMTGGTSYCIADFHNMAIGSTKGLLSITHRGNYPLYDVQIKIVDIDELQRLVAEDSKIGLTSATQIFNLGTVGGGLDHMRWVNLQLGEASPRSYNIFFSARNGSWTQQLRIVKLEDRWVTASRVHPPGQEPFDFAYDDFPRNPDGTLVWDLDKHSTDSEGFNLVA